MIYKEAMQALNYKVWFVEGENQAGMVEFCDVQCHGLGTWRRAQNLRDIMSDLNHVGKHQDI